jgi:hypothetical protein
VRWHGEKIGDALNPLDRHSVRNLQEDGMAAPWAYYGAVNRPSVSFVSE